MNERIVKTARRTKIRINADEAQVSEVPMYRLTHHWYQTPSSTSNITTIINITITTIIIATVIIVAMSNATNNNARVPRALQMVDRNGNPVDTTDMTPQERVKRLQSGNLMIPEMEHFTILEPSSVKVPHHNGHPTGVINLLDPSNSTNTVSYKPNTGTYAMTDGTPASEFDALEISQAIHPAKPGQKTVLTRRFVPEWVDRKIGRLSELGTRSVNPTDRPRLDAPLSDRGGHSGGSRAGRSAGAAGASGAGRSAGSAGRSAGGRAGGRSGRSRGRANRRSRANRARQPVITDRLIEELENEAQPETELERLDRELDEYNAQVAAERGETAPVSSLFDVDEEVDEFMNDIQ
ncbi:hypothetical protein F5Y03DRAFT_396432 [Xylaria venustula]|nr:hypothetical protein F5Y03DRAFT_396432 [Xylaria venustula]